MREPTFFARRDELRAWLAEHHEGRDELWVGLHKRATGRPSVTWPQAVALPRAGHSRSSCLVIRVMTTHPEATTMLEGIVYTTVLVSDQDRALDFYTNVLGLEQRIDNPTPDGPRFLTVAVKGQDFQLVLWPGTPGQAQPVYGRVPAAYTIETGDCRKAFEALQARGVHFDTGVLEYPWGYVAVFQDPDGNRLQLREGRQ